VTKQKSAERLADFKWESVSAYHLYLDVQAQLIPFSISNAYSFNVTSTGLAGLVDRKTDLLSVLEVNLKNIQTWAEDNKDSVDKWELVFLKSVWATTKQLRDMVASQVERAERLLTNQTSFLASRKQEEGDNGHSYF